MIVSPQFQLSFPQSSFGGVLLRLNALHNSNKLTHESLKQVYVSIKNKSVQIGEAHTKLDHSPLMNALGDIRLDKGTINCPGRNIGSLRQNTNSKASWGYSPTEPLNVRLFY
jgi:hypothetical protein